MYTYTHCFSFFPSRRISLRKASRFRSASRALQTYCQQKYLAAWHYLKIDRQRFKTSLYVRSTHLASELSHSTSSTSSPLLILNVNYFTNIFRCYRRDLLSSPCKKIIFAFDIVPLLQ